MSRFCFVIFIQCFQLLYFITSNIYIKLSFKKTEEEENVHIKNMVKKRDKKIDIKMNKYKKNYVK
jgi:p-aminobenzoyl-glutamate transporter AbgT